MTTAASRRSRSSGELTGRGVLIRTRRTKTAPTRHSPLHRALTRHRHIEMKETALRLRPFCGDPGSCLRRSATKWHLITLLTFSSLRSQRRRTHRSARRRHQRGSRAARRRDGRACHTEGRRGGAAHSHASAFARMACTLLRRDVPPLPPRPPRAASARARAVSVRRAASTGWARSVTPAAGRERRQRRRLGQGQRAQAAASPVMGVRSPACRPRRATSSTLAARAAAAARRPIRPLRCRRGSRRSSLGAPRRARGRRHTTAYEVISPRRLPSTRRRRHHRHRRSTHLVRDHRGQRHLHGGGRCPSA